LASQSHLFSKTSM